MSEYIFPSRVLLQVHQETYNDAKKKVQQSQKLWQQKYADKGRKQTNNRFYRHTFLFIVFSQRVFFENSRMQYFNLWFSLNRNFASRKYAAAPDNETKNTFMHKHDEKLAAKAELIFKAGIMTVRGSDLNFVFEM